MIGSCTLLRVTAMNLMNRRPSSETITAVARGTICFDFVNARRFGFYLKQRYDQYNAAGYASPKLYGWRCQPLLSDRQGCKTFFPGISGRNCGVHLSWQYSQRTISSSVRCARQAKRADPGEELVEPHIQEYWDVVLQGVDKPSAKRLIQFIDTSVPLGLPQLYEKIQNGTKAHAKPPAFSFFLETKKQYPDKVILVRVGEFYETIGIDAVLLVQHAGLNPMGKEGNPPRAGCPRANLRRTVSDLVEGAGLSVVVCEEAPEPYSYGSARRTPKQRYVAAIVTPAAPHFLHGMIDEEVNIPVEKTPPLLGIAPTVGGYSVIEVDAELMTVRVTEGLTEDAVYSRLHEGGLVPPLFLHTPLAAMDADKRIRDSIPEVEWKERIKYLFRTQGTQVIRYSDPDPIRGMLGMVKKQLGLPDTHVFTHLPSSSPKVRPRPLYFSTASNLGLHKTRGVPSILDFMLPSGAPLSARRWMRSLLLMPPSGPVALAIHTVCRELLYGEHGAVPEFLAISPANIVLKLRTKEGNYVFFNELRDLCKIVEASCSARHLSKLTDALLVAAATETGVAISREDLADACRMADETIREVVVDESFREDVLDDIDLQDGADSSPMLRMKRMNEDFVGKILPERIPQEMENVSTCWKRMQIEANACLSLAQQAIGTPDESNNTSKRLIEPYLSYDVNNNACWVKLPRGIKILSSQAATLGLEHPRDRNGKIESAVYSTPGLESAQDEYRRCCAAARDAVREELQALADRLLPCVPQLVCGATLSLIACSLDLHVREGKRRGWNLPTLKGFDPIRSNGPHHDHSGLHVVGAWPYWLGGSGNMDLGVVKNSFDMKGMFLLTGPNMAGKSTVLRSTCAVALLGACGLLVPADSLTEIPYIDAFMLRNFSSDSPLEGRSSFAVEMIEMRYVLEDVTSRSLVLVDELGKGTEARAGAALAGSMLEALDASGCIGAFATHLHDLLEINLHLPNTTNMMMETAVVWDQQHEQYVTKPTLRMISGSSTQSLALDVARQCRISPKIIQRADELYQGLKERVGMHIEEPSTSKTEHAEFALHPGSTQDDKFQDIPSEKLKQVAKIMYNTSRNVLQSLYESEEAPDISIQYVPPNQNPGVHTVNRSCVYVAHRPRDDRIYVGSTDSLQTRMQSHRSPSSQSQVKDPDASFIYVSLPSGVQGASAARTLEAALIRECLIHGHTLLSTWDMRRRHGPPTQRSRKV